MKTLPLFASYVSTIELNHNIKELKNFNEDFGESGNEGSCSISKDKRVLEKYPETKKLLLDTFKKIAKEEFEYKEDFIITTSWFTKTEKTQDSNLHRHKNSFYSGVYYYGDRYDSNCGNLVLSSPVQELSDFLITPESWNFFNATTFQIYPQPSLVVFFPSYIVHKFESNYSNNSRYSLAFNIVPIGFYGEGDSSYDTSWFN